tara:strand:+ start:421 stop:609 length:189 start_codon:yes stop_codon:yes gene_type:complete
MNVEVAQVIDMARHLSYLYKEVEIINSRIQPHDCGHLKTTVSTLKNRILEIEKEMDKLSASD